MAYPNLRAEMARKGIGISELMVATGKSRPGISNNLNGKGKFSIDESIAIRDSLFSGMALDYLFSQEEAPEESPA